MVKKFKINKKKGPGKSDPPGIRQKNWGGAGFGSF